METSSKIRLEIGESVRAHDELLSNDNIHEQLARWADSCALAIGQGGTAFFAGNGGSFADSQHLAAELTGKMGRARRSLPGIALGTNSSAMSAIGNDFDFDLVFVRELAALARIPSTLTVLSTSGNSRNIVALVREAQAMGIAVLGLTGRSGGQLADVCDVIRVPSDRTERIQEMHILLGHILCLLIEDALIFDAPTSPGAHD